MKRYVAIAVSVLALAACTMPSTTVRTTDTRPSLAFEGAPDGSVPD